MPLKHPAMPRTAPTAKNYLTSNVNSGGWESLHDHILIVIPTGSFQLFPSRVKPQRTSVSMGKLNDMATGKSPIRTFWPTCPKVASVYAHHLTLPPCCWWHTRDVNLSEAHRPPVPKDGPLLPGCPLSLQPILFLLKLPKRNPHPSPLTHVPVQPSGITEASDPPHSPETVVRVLQAPLEPNVKVDFQCSATSAPSKLPTSHLSEKIARDSQARRPSGPTPPRGSDAALSHPGAEVVPAQAALPNSRPNGNNVTWPLSGARRLEPAVFHLPCTSFWNRNHNCGV